MKNSNMIYGHSDTCHYNDDDCMQYAFLHLKDDFFALIDASEIEFFDELMEKGRSKETDIMVDEDSVENELYKIVYGGILFNDDRLDEEKTLQTVEAMKNYSYIHIEKEKATICTYSDIKLFPQLKKGKNFIPFAALMKIPFHLKDRDNSITLTPCISSKDKEYCIWEFMVNRPFLMACRDEYVDDTLTEKNFEEFIDVERMMEAYKVADLVTG